MPIRQKITPALWFDDNGEEAVAFYCSLFPNSRVTQISRYTEGSHGTPGKVMALGFELDGQAFSAINGGPIFKFNSAISFFVDCDDQDEIDRLYGAILDHGGTEQQCGWIADRYGLNWQINTAELIRMLSDGVAARAQRVMQAMLAMKKIDIAALRAAYAG